MIRLDQKKPLVLIIGSIASEGVLSSVKASGRQYQIKYLRSKPENWWSIIRYFSEFEIHVALIKLDNEMYKYLSSDEYAEVKEALFEQLSLVRHGIFVYEDLLSPQSIPEDQNEGARKGLKFKELFISRANATTEERIDINKFFLKKSLNVIPWRRKAQVIAMAIQLISEAEKGLLLRIYIPKRRILANETDKVLQLFQDYLSRVEKISVQLQQHYTANGTVYEFYSKEKGSNDPKLHLANRFQDFSELLAMCIADPKKAEDLLRAKNVNNKDAALILTKYVKESRRLSIDIKQELEQKHLSIRHRLESELVDVISGDESLQVIGELVDAAVPKFNSFDSLISPEPSVLNVAAKDGAVVTVNINSQVIHAANAIIADEIEGNVTLGPSDIELMKIIQQYGKERKTELSSAVREVADSQIPKSERQMAGQKLKAFLYSVADKAADLGVGLLQTYIEKQTGL